MVSAVGAALVIVAPLNTFRSEGEQRALHVVVPLPLATEAGGAVAGLGPCALPAPDATKSAATSPEAAPPARSMLLSEDARVDMARAATEQPLDLPRPVDPPPPVTTTASVVSPAPAPEAALPPTIENVSASQDVNASRNDYVRQEQRNSRLRRASPTSIRTAVEDPTLNNPKRIRAFFFGPLG